MTEKKTAAKSKWAVVRPEILSTTFGGDGSPLQSLRMWNIVLAGVFALQAIAVLVFGNATALPVSVSYLTTDPLQTAAQGTTVRTLATHHLFDLNILALVVIVLLAAALVHALLATVYHSRYEAEVSNGTNRLRWLGYAITTALLTLVVAMMLGVQDVALLIAIIALCVVQNLAGWMVERHDLAIATRQKLGIIVGGLAGISSLAIPGLYLLGALVNGMATPGYADGLFIVSALAFGLFSVNLLLHHRHIGRWAGHVFAERAYMLLYLVITSALAWQLFAGVLR